MPARLLRRRSSFLQWSGWVRVITGCPPKNLYLVGVLRLSPSARRLLEENIYIDLTPLVNDLRSRNNMQLPRPFAGFLEQSKPAPAYVWNLNNQPFDAFVQADTQPERNRLAALDNLRSRTRGGTNAVNILAGWSDRRNTGTPSKAVVLRRTGHATCWIAAKASFLSSLSGAVA